MLMNSQKLIPGTNGEMTEHDLYVLLTQLEENNNFIDSFLNTAC